MSMEVYFPQLEEALDKATEILELLKTLVGKVDALTPATTAAKPASIVPRAEKAKPVRGKLKILDVKHVPSPADTADGEDETDVEGETDEEEADLRARAVFEARRVTRQFGIAGTRSTIKKITGSNILTVDDVSAAKLPALIDALQAL